MRTSWHSSIDKRLYRNPRSMYGMCRSSMSALFKNRDGTCSISTLGTMVVGVAATFKSDRTSVESSWKLAVVQGSSSSCMMVYICFSRME